MPNYTPTTIRGDMIYGSMSMIHLFPYYQTREEYERVTGRQCPFYDPNIPVKHWEDTSAYTEGKPTITYLVIGIDPVSKFILVDEYGQPFLEPMTLPVNHAARVNIPDKITGADVVIDNPVMHPQYQGEVRMPIRALNYDEEFVLGGFTGVTVRKKEAPLQPHDQIIQRMNSLEIRLITKLELLQEMLKANTSLLQGTGQGTGQGVGQGGANRPLKVPKE